MRIEDLEKEAKEALEKFPFIKRMEIFDKHRGAIKRRLYVKESFYVQAYYNLKTGTTNFVALIGNQRIFGRDCDRDGWHRHPSHAPDTHDFSSEGKRKVTLLEFLEELQELVERENLL